MGKNPNTDLSVYAVKGGMSPKKAAKATGVHKTTIWRALKRAKTALEQLERVRSNRKREALERASRQADGVNIQRVG